MERRWRTRRNNAGVNGIGIGLCFRSRRSCYEKLGKRVEAGLCIACGKEPCESRTSERHHQRRERQGTTWPVSSFCPKPKRKRNFQRACPADQALASSNTATTPAVAILPDMRHLAHGSSARFPTPAGPQESFMPTRPDSSCPCWFPSRTLLMPPARANAWASPRERSAT